MVGSCTWNAAVLLLHWLLHIRTLPSAVLWHDCNPSEELPKSVVSFSLSRSPTCPPPLYQAGSITNIPRGTTTVLQCTPGVHQASTATVDALHRALCHRTFFFFLFQSCLDVLRGLFTKHSIENGDDGGCCGAGWKGECIIRPLLCFYNFLRFKWSSSAVYFEPALHAQPRMLCTTILWHAIRPRGGVAYVLGLGGGHIEFEDFVFPPPLHFLPSSHRNPL